MRSPIEPSEHRQPRTRKGRGFGGVITLEWSKLNSQCVRGRGTWLYRGRRWRVELRQLHLGYISGETVGYADVDGSVLVVAADGSGKRPTARLMVEIKKEIAAAVDREASARGAY